MPGLQQGNSQFNEVETVQYSSSSSCSGGPVSANGIWSKHRNEMTFDRLQKFWVELPPHARKELLRIDKQTLFEQARKNLYCSRCNGLLLEGFSHIVLYGVSMKHEGGAVMHLPPIKPGALRSDGTIGDTPHLSFQDDVQDPFIHPWGGLTAARDGTLTLLDCFLDTKSLKALQNVFDSARMRERQRKLLYPDACGGGDRGWISQGMTNYGRGHGTREACALHTARLPCETLLGFWSALGDETQQSLLRMKEEDFIERLMYRFESKRFCRDCRRNVIREFKELKELKRMRRETRCTIWFCVADLAFDYEVSDNTIQADWHQSFTESIGTYHHFEWAVGTGEGKSDIVEFEDVGMSRSAQVTGLDLGGLTSCFITVRAWKLDGRCSEVSVKAHALKGQPCVHRRLLVGDGFVTVTEGGCIGRFFEQAEEAEEDEDDDSMDKDGNELDREGSRLQKHAKSPELAREFLLDAAIVIFKEQVEKAFREGTARQNAHSIFVCLALKLLEERIHVACKEIITLEKQIKLLEEEEKEKREQEERKERKKTKEKEKKLRRKEKLKGKDKENENKCDEFNEASTVPDVALPQSSPDTKKLPDTVNSEDSHSESGDIMLDMPHSPDIQDKQYPNGTSSIQNINDDSEQFSYVSADSGHNSRDVSGRLMVEHSKSSHKLRFGREYELDSSSRWSSRSRINDESGYLDDEFESRSRGDRTEISNRRNNSFNRQPRNNTPKFNARICGSKYGEKFYCSNYRVRDRYESNSKACGCNMQSDCRQKDGLNSSITTSDHDMETKSESSSDVSRSLFHKSKYTNGYYSPDSCRNPRNKIVTGRITNRDYVHIKQVWEPVKSRKGCPRSNSDPDIALRSSNSEVDACKEDQNDSNERQQVVNLLQPSGISSSYEHSENSDNISSQKDNCSPNTNKSTSFVLEAKSPCDSNNSSPGLIDEAISVIDLGNRNTESLPISASDDGTQQSQGRETSTSQENETQNCLSFGEGKSVPSKTTENQDGGFEVQNNLQQDLPSRIVHNPDNDRIMDHTNSQQPYVLPSMNNAGISFPVFPAPSTLAYYHQSPASWSATPVNTLMSFPQPGCFYLPTPFGYGLPENQPAQFHMQYSTIQPVINLVDFSQHPAVPLVEKTNIVNSQEQTKNINLTGVQESATIPDRRPVSSCQEAPLGQGGNYVSSNKDSSNFSLFHFGGPISTATGNDPNKGYMKEKTVGDTFSHSPSVDSRAQFDCTGKVKSGEEYSLFAASNSFSFLLNEVVHEGC